MAPHTPSRNYRGFVKEEKSLSKRREEQMSSPVRSSLIPGLPDEVALMILARQPRALYGYLSRVCHAWRDALRSSSAMTALRNSLHISEVWPVLICFSPMSITLYDPLLRHHSFPIPYLRKAHSLIVPAIGGAVGSQVYIVHQEPSAEILCFDAASMHWQVDSIPLWGKVSVMGLACCVVDGHLWLVGEGADARAAMRLDVKSRRWEKMPKMHERRVKAAAVELDGRLHVIGGYCTHGGNMVHSGEIWDSSMGEWILQPELWPCQLDSFYPPKDVAVVMDTLYALVKDVELVHYVSKSKIWASLGHLPLEEYPCSCGGGRYPRLAGVGRELWVVLNCKKWRKRCTAKILSCVPATGSLPLLWRSVSSNLSNKFPPGYVIVNGQVHV